MERVRGNSAGIKEMKLWLAERYSNAGRRVSQSGSSVKQLWSILSAFNFSRFTYFLGRREI